jgi:3-dehydroquinate synthase
MKKVRVELGHRAYEIRVGSDVLSRAGLWLKEKGFAEGKAVVITDTTVNDLYGETVKRSLDAAGYNATVLEVPPGEERKTLETAGRLYKRLAEAYAERSTPVVALGGGMIGDLAGFVAATYMRGVPLVQIPTTLLAQVDSSIGGKTAVDHGRYKNMVGAFYQPGLVIADVDTLKTLPPEEFSNGMAEVIKHGAIRNKAFFHFLEEKMGLARALEPKVLEVLVAENARIKAEVVEKDERESGLREILNYGHTIGHALETVSGFELKHGQGVALGMVAAARIADRIGMLDINEAHRLRELIQQAGLPVEMPDYPVEAVLAAMKHDKKVQQDRIRFVLLKVIGEAHVTDKVPPEVIEEVLLDR